MTVEDDIQEDPADRTINRLVGEHLRGLRREKGLSLQQVEALTEHRFKASVLGAYERGERALSVARLDALAKEYGLPMLRLLPPSMVEGDRPVLSISVEGDVELRVTRDGETRGLVGD